MDTGNTSFANIANTVSAVQPRGYGEHNGVNSTSGVNCGSAPWIRGTHLKIGRLALACRFSPVDTGNTGLY